MEYLDKEIYSHVFTMHMPKKHTHTKKKKKKKNVVQISC